MKTKAFFVALLAFALAGCSTVGSVWDTVSAPFRAEEKPAAQKPLTLRSDQTKPAATAPAVQTAGVRSQGQVTAAMSPLPAPTFPKSDEEGAGKLWEVAHQSGFTGDYAVASKLLGLTAEQAKKYQEMHSKGQCVTAEAPKGAVLNRLTFTRDAKHRVMARVKVVVENPEHRKAEVCHLGDGLYVGRFFFCSNHFRVNGDPPVTPVAPVPPPPAPKPAPAAALAVTPAGCSTLTLEFDVWDGKKLSPELQTRVAEVHSRETGYFGASVSRQLGKVFREQVGDAGLSNVPREIAVSYEDAGTWKPLGTLKATSGKTLFQIPDYALARRMKAEFGGSDIMSPPKGVMMMDMGEMKPPVARNDCRRVAHAVTAFTPPK